MWHLHGRLESEVGSSRNQRRHDMQVALPPTGGQRHADGETTSPAELTLNGNLAAHEFAELLAQRQTQPRAAILARAGIIGDREFLK